MNPSINETSDKIMQRTKELIAKEKSKPIKLSITAIIISLLSFLFSIFTFYDNRVNKLSIPDAAAKQQTTTKATDSNE